MEYAVVGVAALVCVVFWLVVASAFVNICPPNQILVLSGRARRVGDQVFGYRLIRGGRAIRFPLIEKVDRLDLRDVSVELVVDAKSAEGDPIVVRGSATVHVVPNEPIVRNAVMRLLGRSPDEVGALARLVLECNIRAISGATVVDRLCADGTWWSEVLGQAVEKDLAELGLGLGVLSIVGVRTPADVGGRLQVAASGLEGKA
jgi:flotillin